MFLNQLSLEEKEAFLSLSVNAAKANGEFTAEEHLMVEEYCREMGIAFFDMSETKTVDEIAEVYKNSTEQHKKIVVFEILGLMFADGNYDSQEKEFVLDFVGRIGVTEEEVDKEIGLLQEYLGVVKRVAEEIE